ncbi:hypothetical protein M885DRAFT_255893 [Pelagophyceae sp. CCMP2097]|nr:hypothetical protein M885DRAFT_255893 [Pelagophyceae sp. CCMP2097]|mmetsp:Transcript_13815/g.46063  ORF Transcript_13815/g.46063 Transcript_13815/m.46063 type:complete len:152 (+) Transcript_13815:57-512(+)
MDAISAFVRQSSQTNIPWGTRRSHLIGASALCYALPAVHDGLHANPRLILWLLQALACFWSDYVDSGKAAISHFYDKCLASTLVTYVVYLALVHRGPVFVAVLAAPTFWCYGRSTASRRAGDESSYAVWHSLWHLCGGVVSVLTLQAEGGL